MPASALKSRCIPIVWLLLATALATVLTGQPPALAQTPTATPPLPAISDPWQAEDGPRPSRYSGCGGDTAPTTHVDYEQQVVFLTNIERAARNIPPLKRVEQLDQATRYHAVDMAADGYFEHDTYDRGGGSLQYVCDPWSRILTYYDQDWRSLGENIAAGYSTPTQVMAAWMSSAGHRNNMLSENYWEIGSGYYSGNSRYGSYWVQDFGRRDGVYPLIIDGEAPRTESRTVSLYLYGSGDWDEMRLRNNDGSWSAWRPFQAELPWQLDPINGEQQVSAELRRGGQTTSSSDTIIADLPIPRLAGLPNQLIFLYDASSDVLTPPARQLTPTNPGTPDSLPWQAATQGDWLALSATQGQTPAAITVTPTNLTAYPPGHYEGSITVTVDQPDVAGSPHQITVRLVVMDRPFEQVLLPLVRR